MILCAFIVALPAIIAESEFRARNVAARAVLAANI